MKRTAFFVFILLSVSIVYGQNTDKPSNQTKFLPVGVYFEAIIPPIIKQINHNAPDIFSGGTTYMDFGLGVTLCNDILKAQINYGFLTQDNYEALGGEGHVRYGGNVLGIKFLAGPEINLGDIFGSKWDRLSASLGLGFNFSLFDFSKQEYTQSGEPEWLHSWELQLEFPKITFPDRKFLRAVSVFLEYQVWYLPIDVPTTQFIKKLVLGVRVYIL
jgi:hypothetical protein